MLLALLDRESSLDDWELTVGNDELNGRDDLLMIFCYMMMLWSEFFS